MWRPRRQHDSRRQAAASEIAVISLGGIVTNKSIQIAGDDLTEDIIGHMRRAHNVKVGERTAELIKMNVGSALTEPGREPAGRLHCPWPQPHHGPAYGGAGKLSGDIAPH